MSTNISLFPMIDERLLDRIRYQKSEYRFYYVRNEEEYKLNSEELEAGVNIHKLVDEDGIWTPDDYKLHMKRQYVLRTYRALFGENGVVCKNAELGIATIWTSADSRQRGMIPVGEFKCGDDDLKFELNYEFSKAQLRGSVEFTTVIYLKNKGVQDIREIHLANEYGCILGELDSYVIQLDGTGSIFPIYEVAEPNQPLWYVKCDWEDPTYEQFVDAVSININTAHKSYKFLDKTKKSFNEQLLGEIMSSALILIITKLKEQENYWDSTISGVDLQNGSVSEAIYYFISTLEWSVSSPESLSLSIRKFFDQRT